MESEIKTGKKIYIRNAGKDEYWLQDIIFENPSILGLGDLIPLSKEKKQSTGGKLDILLKNPEDNSMYEIEVMLNETDPSHIIRTIEYWDIEKRRYPQRQHFPVLIAERFNKRYFNVIQLLSLNIPMIAIQVDLLEVGNQKIVNFTTILDIYEEPAENDETNIVKETTWTSSANWTLQAASELLNIFNSSEQVFKLKFTQSYIAITNNQSNAYWMSKRSEPKSYFGFKEKNEEKVEAIRKLLDEASINFTYNKSHEFLITVDKDFIKKNQEVFIQINTIRYKSEDKETSDL